MDSKSVTTASGKRCGVMGIENLNTTNGDRSYDQEGAKAVFCEKLLKCCVCGKIYFSRHPIALLTVSAKDYFLCYICARKLKCSICGEPISPKTTLVIENPTRAIPEFLCHSCRGKALAASGTSLLGIAKRLQAKATSTVAHLLVKFRRITRLQVWPLRGRR